MSEFAQQIWPFVACVAAVALIFGAFPTLMMNLLARVYPPGHERRRELPAELAAVPRRERVTWVFENVVTVIFDGVPARWRFQRRPKQPQTGTIGPIFLTFRKVCRSDKEALTIAKRFGRQARLVKVENGSVTVRLSLDELDLMETKPLQQLRPARTRPRWWRIRRR